MRYRLLHNLDGFDPFREGDRLADGFLGFMEVGANLTMSAVCDDIFARHNRDDRPDGKTAPSLSVGDVVLFYALGAAYTVERLGWREVDVEAVERSRTFARYLDSIRN